MLLRGAGVGECVRGLEGARGSVRSEAVAEDGSGADSGRARPRRGHAQKEKQSVRGRKQEQGIV